MKAVAALMVVAAVTMAAPSTGTNTGDLSITKITYNDEAARQAVGAEVETEICAENKNDLGPTEANVRIQITLPGEETDNRDADELTQEKKCAKFSALMPSNNTDVLYTLIVTPSTAPPASSLMTDTDVKIAMVHFNFQELEDQQQITCGDNHFKITAQLRKECNGIETEENCYEITNSPVTGDGCVNVTSLPNFEYCQPTAVHVYSQKPENGEQGAESLTYNGGTATLTLGDAADAGANGVDVIVMSSDTPDTFQVVSLIVPEEGKKGRVETGVGKKGSVVLESFNPSAALYTACPVRGEFIEYTINDLFILGTREKVPSTGGEFYYEFGLMYNNKNHTKYVASTDTTALKDDSDLVGTTMTINCGNLKLNERCYGYVKDEGGSKPNPLTVSYDGPDRPNKIIVDNNNISMK